MISVIVPVYRDTANATALVEALLQQEFPPDCSLEIIVVDDGSDDASVADLLRLQEDRVRVLALPSNAGRSRARNAGADQAKGEFLAFVDCDCRPTDQHFLAAHLRLLRSDCIASCGPVTGDGRGFWSRYQDDASSRRARQHARGVAYAGSTQNFAVRAEAFRQCGGFDSRYKTYGFEDRDLFVRLSDSGAIGWCAEAAVRHLDPLSLTGVLSKMQLAAGESAILFSRDHADAYRKLGYAALDARLHGWLRPVCTLLHPTLRIAPAIDNLLARRRVPYPIARIAVRLFSALAYSHGTTTIRPRD